MILSMAGSGADIIAQWDFNSLSADDDTSTGTVLPSTGNGAVVLIGGATAVFAPGCGDDPASSDNSALNTSAYPAQGSKNKTAGVQFAVSTAGYSNIMVGWQHKVSSSASKYCCLQYSLDGIHFVDHPERITSIFVSSGTSVFEPRTRRLDWIPEVADNQNFAFRIVTEFESTATGNGTEGYVTTFGTNKYSSSGTIRFDLVTVTGTPIPGGNTTPVLSSIPCVSGFAGLAIGPIHVTIGDLETRAENLSLWAVSSNPILVPNTAGNIWVGGYGSNRMLNLSPAYGVAGVAPIKVTLSDGTNQANSVFPLVVLPSRSVLFYDRFEYSNGPLLANSCYLWNHRAGAFGQCEVTNGLLQITSKQTEDVLAPLRGGPWRPGSNLVLYAAFKARFLALPGSSPAYFAHFANGNLLCARIFASSGNALPGCFKLFISNGSDSVTPVPWNLHTNTTYTLVSRYEIDSSTATLWVNPTSEADDGYRATDLQNPSAITAYGFRQDAGLGCTILVDDLVIGLSFAAVTFGALGPVNPLTIQASGGTVVLTWSVPGMHLQSASALASPFVDLPASCSPYSNRNSGYTRFFRLYPD